MTNLRDKCQISPDNTAVVLPVYNSSRHLKSLISKLLEYVSPKQIIAVDDGSIDDSAELCSNLGIHLIRFQENRGKGAALWAGMQKAKDLGYKFAFTIDSDEQHNPQQIPVFWQQQQKENSDLILGKRSFKVQDMPWQRICSNRLTSFIVSITVKRDVYDSQCGYRLYRLSLIHDLEIVSQRYQFETEIILKLCKENIKISHVAIDTIYGDETSHIKHGRDIYNFVKLIFSYWLGKI